MGNFFKGLKFSSFLPGIGNILDAGIGILSGNHAQKQEIAAQKEMQQAAFAQQEYLLDKMNAYNTPAMQMQRYRDAGINPYAALGNIVPGNQSSSGSVPSYPQRVPGGARTLEKYQIIQSALNLAATEASISKQKASASVDEAQAEYIKSRTYGQHQDNAERELEYRANQFVIDMLDNDNSMFHKENGQEYELRWRSLIEELGQKNALNKVLNSTKTLLLDSIIVGQDNTYAPLYAGVYGVPLQGNALLDSRRKLADTIKSETLSQYQEALILSTLSSASLQRTLISSRDEAIQQQIQFRYEAWNWLLNQQKFKSANLEQRNIMMQSATEILQNKAYYSSYNELINAISGTVDVASDAVSAIIPKKGATNIKNQTNVTNNNAFDGTIPY